MSQRHRRKQRQRQRQRQQERERELLSLDGMPAQKQQQQELPSLDGMPARHCGLFPPLPDLTSWSEGIRISTKEDIAENNKTFQRSLSPIPEPRLPIIWNVDKLRERDGLPPNDYEEENAEYRRLISERNAEELEEERKKFRLARALLDRDEKIKQEKERTHKKFRSKKELDSLRENMFQKFPKLRISGRDSRSPSPPPKEDEEMPPMSNFSN